MRFLADESCDFAVVRALRAAGHDVTAVAEHDAGIDDARVIELARGENRVLLTEDKDFGQLVFAALAGSGGVMLIRHPANARGELGATVARLTQSLGDRLPGAFVTISPGRARIRRLPLTDD